MILVQGRQYRSWTANCNIALPFELLKHRVDWLNLFVYGLVQGRHYVSLWFPEPRACMVFLKGRRNGCQGATMAAVHTAAALWSLQLVYCDWSGGLPGHRTQARMLSRTRSPALPLRAPSKSRSSFPFVWVTVEESRPRPALENLYRAKARHNDQCFSWISYYNTITVGKGCLHDW